jgi:hypothetical protein
MTSKAADRSKTKAARFGRPGEYKECLAGHFLQLFLVVV